MTLDPRLRGGERSLWRRRIHRSLQSGNDKVRNFCPGSLQVPGERSLWTSLTHSRATITRSEISNLGPRFHGDERDEAATDQSGISSSMSSCLPPAAAIAGLRSRDAVGPGEPKSPLSEPAPPPARSRIVRAELKPCKTTSGEKRSGPSF